MGFETSDIRRMQADLGRLSARAIPVASKAIAKTTLDIEADAKTLAPVDTGNLRGSISSDIKTLSSEVGPTADYGRYVEEGTSRMAPQPYMGPAADRRFPELELALGTIVDGP